MKQYYKGREPVGAGGGGGGGGGERGCKYFVYLFVMHDHLRQFQERVTLTTLR